jgi:hypothetical protein
MTLSGARPTLNANAQRGVVLAELCDAGGAVLPGFTKGRCVPIRGDVLDAPLMWEGTPWPPADVGQIRLRLTLDEATVYAASM